jgi:hypothetical protein
MNERLTYALIGQLHPDDAPQHDIVLLDTQEKVDEANERDFRI